MFRGAWRFSESCRCDVGLIRVFKGEHTAKSDTMFCRTRTVKQNHNICEKSELHPGLYPIIEVNNENQSGEWGFFRYLFNQRRGSVGRC